MLLEECKAFNNSHLLIELLTTDLVVLVLATVAVYDILNHTHHPRISLQYPST